MGNQGSRENEGPFPSAGAHCDIGGRKSMEDAHLIGKRNGFSLFGVFDGHGGKAAADWSCRTLPEVLERWYSQREYETEVFADEERTREEICKVFTETDRRLVSSIKYCGCTVLLLLYPEQCSVGKKFAVVNLGDSRAVLCSQGKAIPISEDHRPTNPKEVKRIKDAGGCVVFGRVNGQLAVSRSFGDAEMKKTKGSSSGLPVISCLPDVYVRTMEPTDEFVILACDGIWDMMTNEEAVERVKKSRKEGKSSELAAKDLVTSVLEANALAADNLTCIVVYLSSHPRLKENET